MSHLSHLIHVPQRQNSISTIFPTPGTSRSENSNPTKNKSHIICLDDATVTLVSSTLFFLSTQRKQAIYERTKGGASTPSTPSRRLHLASSGSGEWTQRPIWKNENQFHVYCGRSISSWYIMNCFPFFGGVNDGSIYDAASS